jgi:hypothetical protein
MSVSSSDDEFFHAWAAQRKMALETTMDPSVVVVEYLKKTSIPYAIIGGKAAAYHLQTRGAASSTSMALAMSTNDYDVVIEAGHQRTFLEELQSELRTKARGALDEKLYESTMVDIVMMGVLKNGMFDSIVDVHILKPGSKNMPKVVRDRSGLKYATVEWICKELEYSMKYHASNDEITKALKRKARFELLQC